MKKLAILTFLLLLIQQGHCQQTVSSSCRAGELSTFLQNKDLKVITSLTLTGEMDVRDFKLISDSMPVLSSLTIRDVHIKYYKWTRAYFGNFEEYKENEIPPYLFLGQKSITQIVLPASLESIGEGAFSGCTSLAAFTFPSTLTNIGDYAFYQCNNLKPSAFPLALSSLGDQSFKGCSSLQNIDLTNCDLYTIGNGTFEDCVNITSIKLPVKLTNIGNNSFQNCVKIETINLPLTLKKIGVGAFYGCNQLKNIQTKHCILLHSIGEWSFANCRNLTSFSFPPQLSKIGKGAFYYCTSLSNIELPASLICLDDFAFSGCHLMNILGLPTPLTTIGQWQFYGWELLTRITLPSNVSYLGSNTFNGCNNLEQLIALSQKPPTLGENVFNGVNQLSCTLFVPETSIPAYQKADQWREFSYIFNTNSTTKADKDKDNLYAYFQEETLYIKSNHIIKSVEMYDFNGRSLFITHVPSTEYSIPANYTDIIFYIVRIHFENGDTRIIKLRK